MRKRLILVFLSAAISVLSFAQNAQLSGKVKDTINNTIPANAVVALIERPDSVIAAFTRVDKQGKFLLPAVKQGSYQLLIMHPDYADYSDNITVTGNETYDHLAIMPKSKLLENVIVRGTAAIRIKGDTTIFAADSFKVSANANVEELLKKLPGLQVDKDGNISAMGKKVEKVLVDGEEFFGEDPGMAVKNLRADAVKEVQVFDKKSEQAEFTGIDDGNTKKTINLKLKDEAKKGYFGKVDLQGGKSEQVSDRYNTNLLLGSFKNKRKISGYYLSGNMGQDGLGWEDMRKYGGDDESMTFSEEGDIFFSRGGTVDDEPYINTENGFSKNQNAGITYSNKWNNKHTLTFSPKYDLLDNTNIQRSYNEQQLILDSVLVSEQTDDQHVNRQSQKNRITYEYILDTSISIKFTGSANFYKTESSNLQNTVRSGLNKSNIKNSVDKNTYINSDKQALSGSLTYKQKFKKPRRTLSFTLESNNYNSDAINRQNMISSDYTGTTPGELHTDIEYQMDKTNAGQNLNGVYTEPLSEKYSLLFGYGIRLLTASNDQRAMSLDNNGHYSNRIDSLSNDFDQRITEQNPSMKLAYQFKKFKANVGLALALTKFRFTDNTLNQDYDRSYTNYAPTAMLNYQYKNNHNISFNYRGQTRQPSLYQLQPLRQLNDQFSQYLGNPNLKPEFTNTINLSHNAYDFFKEIWTYQNLSANFTSNDITNNQFINITNGKTVTQPVNIDGSKQFNLYSGIGSKIKKIDTRVWLNVSVTFSDQKLIMNNVKYAAKNWMYNFNGSLDKSKDKRYEFSFGPNFYLASNKTTLNDTKTITTNLSPTLFGKVYIDTTWTLEAYYGGNYQLPNDRVTEGIYINELNATVSKSFRNDQFKVYFTVRDILNQNKSFSRSFYNNSYFENENQRLRRYFFLGLRWDFKNRGPKPAEEPKAVIIN